MRIRAPDGCKPELVVELRHAAAWVGAEDRWVVCLNAIRPAGGVAIHGNGADRPLLGAERVREAMQQAANAKQQELINSGYDAANKTIDPVLATQTKAFQEEGFYTILNGA